MATNLLDIDDELLSQVINYLPFLNQASLSRVSKRFEPIVDVVMLSYHSLDSTLIPGCTYLTFTSDKKIYLFKLAPKMKNIKHFDLGEMNVPLLFNPKILAANCPKIRSFGCQTTTIFILDYIECLREQNYDLKGDKIIVGAFGIRGVMRNMKYFPPEIVFMVFIENDIHNRINEYLEEVDQSWIDQDRIVDVICDHPQKRWSYTSTTHLECRYFLSGLDPELDKISKTINLVVLKLYLSMSNHTYEQLFNHIQPLTKLQKLNLFTFDDNLIINEQDMHAMKRFLDQNYLILDDLSMKNAMKRFHENCLNMAFLDVQPIRKVENIRLILNTIFQTRTKFKSFSIGPYTLKRRTFELEDQSNSSKIDHMNNVSRLIPHFKNFRRLSFPKYFSSGLTQDEQLAWNLLVDNNRHLVISQ